MGVLLGFAPFVAFAVLSRFVAPSVSLWAGAAVSAALIVRQKMRGGSMKILEIGTLVLFVLLGIYASVRNQRVGYSHRPRRSGWRTAPHHSFVDARSPSVHAAIRAGTGTCGRAEFSDLYQDELHHYRGMGLCDGDSRHC